MKNKLLIFFLWTNSLICFSQTQWKAESSSINFKIKNAGILVKGSFTGLKAEIKFDIEKLSESLIEASVEVITVNTSSDLMDKHLKKEEFFNASKFPLISIKSTGFLKEKDGTFKGLFKLLMKGISKEVIIPFTYKEKSNTAVFEGSFMLNRRDYGVGQSSWTISDNVTVNIVIHAVK